MNSIALEGEYGSGSSEIGQLVSAKLDIPYYDGKALIKAAEAFHFPMALLENYGADEASHILYCLSVIAKQPDFEGVSRTEEVFLTMQKTIQKLDKQHPAVFDGHCANRILSDRGVKSVFIYASDRNDRIRRIVQRNAVSKEQAAAIMRQEDSDRESYYKFWTKEDWRDWSGYDMALNTSKIPIEQCAEILIREMWLGDEKIGNTENSNLCFRR